MGAATQDRIPMVERIALGYRLAKARAEPKPPTWAQLSKREGKPESTLREVHDDYCKAEASYNDPVEITTQSIHLYGETIKGLAEVFEDTKHPNVKIGAARTLLAAVKGRLELLAAIGRLPRELGRAYDEQEAGAMLMTVLEVLERHRLGQEVLGDVLAVIEGESTRRVLTAGDGSVRAAE